jgi:TetR/AcrR family transcriptional regulator
MVKSSSQSRDRDTEQRILDAAHVVFMRRGTAGARMQEIAKEADVNSALLHYYFRSKEGLAEAVFQRAAMQLMPAVIRILGSDAELEAKVEQVVDVELQQLQKTPYLPGYILSELTHHPERVRQLFSAVTGVTPAEIGARVFKVLGAQINRRVKARRMHPIAPEQFAINLLALCVFPFAARPMVMALAGLDQAGFNHFIERRRRELAPFFLRALRP